MIENLIEVTLKSDDAFLLIKETLTRIGISSKKTNTLFQSCHILHKRGKYYIVHFKEMFLLDGKKHTILEENDIARRNTITGLLAQWGLIDVVKPELIKDPIVPVSFIRIIPFKEKDNWILQPKYNIGAKK